MIRPAPQRSPTSVSTAISARQTRCRSYLTAARSGARSYAICCHKAVYQACPATLANRSCSDSAAVSTPDSARPVADGYYADANKTFFVGEPGPDARKIVAVARECLRRGMQMVTAGNTVGDIGWAIQTYAESEGCSVVREFVGHGVGLDFHEPPQVPHFGRKGEGLVLIPGMVFTIEPMINLGRKELRILDDDWTAVTRDGSLSAQFEQTLLVTQEGFESLTPWEE